MAGMESVEGQGRPLLDDPAFRRIFEASTLPSLILDAERREIVAVNSACVEFMGLEAADLLGRPGTDFLSDAAPDQVLRSRALRGDSTRAVRYVRTKAGQRTVEMSIIPLDDGLALVQSVDLTDLIEANAILEEQARTLEKSAAALQTVAARIAHDLRGPLAAITGYLDLLIEDEVDDDKLHMLERVRSNGAKLSEMIERVLGEARADAEAAEDDADAHSVARLFTSVRRLLEVQLAVEGEQPEPSLSTLSTITRLPVPAAAVEPAVMNLLGNSLKYAMPDRALQVALAVTAEADAVVIEVTDNGPGLPDDPEPLFSAGVRGDAAAGTSGSGLGLAFARQAVEELGGTLSARAEEDGGATFRIELPSAAPEARKPVPPGGTVAHGLSASRLDGIIEQWPSPIVIFDLATRRILRANVAAGDVFGMPPGDLIGQPDHSLFAEPDAFDSVRTRALETALPGHLRKAIPIRAAGGAADTRVTLTTFEGTTLAVMTVTLPDPDQT